MSNKTFPIQNESACVFKWGWNTFRLYNGTSSSCHRVTPVKISAESFNDFHNTPEVQNDRRLMLQGQWPVGRGCEYCKNIEEHGGVSDRTYHNNIPGLTPVDFDYTTVATPRISEIYLNNTCDLACVYCLPLFSSKINQELKKFGPYPIGIMPVNKTPDRDLLLKLYLDFLKEHGSKLARLSILGGEPLLQKEFWQILELIPTLNNKNLELSINTNLNADAETIDKFIGIARKLTTSRHLKEIHISASLDCWGDQAKFVRYGLSLENWQRNFETLIKHKWLAISVHQVLTSLTIKTAGELQRRISDYKNINPKIVQEYYLVDSGFEEIYHPEIFGNLFFKDTLDQLLNDFPIATEWDNSARSRLEGIVKLLSNASVDRNRLDKLKKTLNEINQRRNTNWTQLWPEINEYFIQNGI